MIESAIYFLSFPAYVFLTPIKLKRVRITMSEIGDKIIKTEFGPMDPTDLLLFGRLSLQYLIIESELVLLH
jgi:hypothetical protein